MTNSVVRVDIRGIKHDGGYARGIGSGYSHSTTHGVPCGDQRSAESSYLVIYQLKTVFVVVVRFTSAMELVREVGSPIGPTEDLGAATSPIKGSALPLKKRPLKTGRRVVGNVERF